MINLEGCFSPELFFFYYDTLESLCYTTWDCYPSATSHPYITSYFNIFELLQLWQSEGLVSFLSGNEFFIHFWRFWWDLYYFSLANLEGITASSKTDRCHMDVWRMKTLWCWHDFILNLMSKKKRLLLEQWFAIQHVFVKTIQC